MAYSPVAVRADGTNDFLSKTAGSPWSDSTDFTFSCAFKRNGLPATSEFLFRFPNVALRVELTITGRIQCVGRTSSANSVQFLSPVDVNYTDNVWYKLTTSISGGGTPQMKIGATLLTTSVTLSGGTINFSNTGAGWGLLATVAGANKFTGDVADFWFKQGSGVTLVEGEDGFVDASGALKDLGASGMAEGLTPDLWQHRAVSEWHINDGALGDIWTLNGTLEAAPDAPPGATTGGLVAPHRTRRFQHMLVR